MQPPFHIRPDPLKLHRDPLKVVAGSPRDLKILTNGSPGSLTTHLFPLFLCELCDYIAALLTSMGLYMGHVFLCTGNDEKDVE